MAYADTNPDARLAAEASAAAGGGAPGRANAILIGTLGRAVPWALPVLFVAVWEALSRAGLIESHVLAAPSRVAATAYALLLSGELVKDLGVSLGRAALGFAIGGSIGFSLGLLVGFSRVAEAVLDRSIQMVRAIPFLALLPLVIVWFGVGEVQKVFMVALGVAFPIYIGTTLGNRQVDTKLIELGQAQGLGNSTMIRRIVLPGALPSILTGIRIAIATAWLALVVAETVGAQSGLGFLALDAREFLRTDVILLVVVIYAAIGAIADALARLLERRLLAWNPNYGGKT